MIDVLQWIIDEAKNDADADVEKRQNDINDAWNTKLTNATTKVQDLSNLLKD
jgi:hypothetical protein